VLLFSHGRRVTTPAGAPRRRAERGGGSAVTHKP
jgi:hypothetical protein